MTLRPVDGRPRRPSVSTSPAPGASRLRGAGPRGASPPSDPGVARRPLGGRHRRAVAGGPSPSPAVGSLARRDGGPLSDFDLVLLHQTRALGAADLTALADRLWYPIWDQG